MRREVRKLVGSFETANSGWRHLHAWVQDQVCCLYVCMYAHAHILYLASNCVFTESLAMQNAPGARGGGRMQGRNVTARSPKQR
jgi:hypothetical protein